MKAQVFLTALLLPLMLATAFPGSRDAAITDPPTSTESYTVKVWDGAKGTWKTKSYPVLTPSVCPTKGPDVDKGICKDKCMAKYLTPKHIGFLYPGKNGMEFAELDSAQPRWGDADGNHVPNQCLIAEYEKSQGLSHPHQPLQGTPVNTDPANLGTPTPFAPLALGGSHDTVPPTKTEAMEPATQFFPVQNQFVQCGPMHGDERHTPVVMAYVQSSSDIPEPLIVLTPHNPVCDNEDPSSWTDEEKLWLYQNEDQTSLWERAARRPEERNEGHIECYSYESCWDHCQDVKNREWFLLWFFVGIVLSMTVLFLFYVFFRLCMNVMSKRRSRRVVARANKKRSAEDLPVQPSQQVDGPADDEHSVVTTGRESLCSDEGVAKRV